MIRVTILYFLEKLNLKVEEKESAAANDIASGPQQAAQQRIGLKVKARSISLYAEPL
jgi:hypothetical protein